MPKKSQEWDIFYILCPQSLLDIMDDPGLTFANRMRLFLALSRLGFHAVPTAATGNRSIPIPAPAYAGRWTSTISICRMTLIIMKIRSFGCFWTISKVPFFANDLNRKHNSQTDHIHLADGTKIPVG